MMHQVQFKICGHNTGKLVEESMVITGHAIYQCAVDGTYELLPMPEIIPAVYVVRSRTLQTSWDYGTLMFTDPGEAEQYRRELTADAGRVAEVIQYAPIPF